jgi:hypothetical protein
MMERRMDARFALAMAAAVKALTQKRRFTMRLAHLCLGLSAALFLAACGDDGAGPEPLEITSLSPAAQAADVETGATVAVVFNEAIDPVTLTAATFQVKRAGAPLAAALSYEAATRTARAAVPLVPGVTYEVEVTTGVRTPAGSALRASEVWSFTTRAWQAATVDAAGSAGTYTSLAVDGSGRLHISYYNGALQYATCAAACATAANWQVATVDAGGGGGGVGLFTSLAVDGSGRLHVSYDDEANFDLKYATCAAACATAANWQAATVDAGSVGHHTSLAVDGSGRLHVSYFDNTKGDLKYATCAAACATAANWQERTVESAEAVGAYTSLAVDGSGRLHVSYFDATNRDLKYATCAAACATAAWQAATVDAAGDVGGYTSLAVDGSGRLHVSYEDATNRDLKYATCAAACATAANWQAATVDAAGTVGRYTSLAVDAAGSVGLFNSLAVNGSGRLHVSYFDNTNGDLKYIQ